MQDILLICFIGMVVSLAFAILPPTAFTSSTCLYSDDEIPIPRFSHRTALVSCHGDAEVPLQHLSYCLPSNCRAGWRLQPMPPWVHSNAILLLFDILEFLYLQKNY
jgi:hypothetical protein